MAMVMKDNYIMVRAEEKAFRVASNFTNYVLLGRPGGDDYFLEARVENGDFLIDAALYDSTGTLACRLRDSFPREGACKKRMLPNGFAILAEADRPLFGVEVIGNVAHLKGTVYDSKGQVIAEDKGDDFLVYKGPMVLGRAGASRGLVLN